MRPIDAYVLVKKFEALEEWETLFNTYGTAIRETNDMPTLDVRQNIHAHWIEVDYTFPYKCSACGNHQDLMTNFCWNCGAIMDEEDEYD